MNIQTVQRPYIINIIRLFEALVLLNPLFITYSCSWPTDRTLSTCFTRVLKISGFQWWYFYIFRVWYMLMHKIQIWVNHLYIKVIFQLKLHCPLWTLDDNLKGTKYCYGRVLAKMHHNYNGDFHLVTNQLRENNSELFTTYHQ